MEVFAGWLVSAVHGFGYLGLFITMFFGNVLVPIPVEAIMIPAGYLVQDHEMRFFPVMLSAISGDILGSLFSYYLSAILGHRFFMKYGKYVFLKPHLIEKLDHFFRAHGEISVLTGRLTPGLRHFMAFPAGMARMHIKRFVLYTGVGGGLWMSVLVLVGYMIGGNRKMIRHYMPLITTCVLIGMGVIIIIYTYRHRKKMKKGNDDGMA